ncbi:hypothetical protein V8B55DRAFT_1557658 [Mucor lusitanicus]|uniref:Cysteine-rich transmembrane CYSTM domain-containing protein n=4 Tax=Mucor TaxID=4830 RepID=A0A168H2U1_MUCCL|nr:hypothetical protein HMPREF1544_08253 [Mucor circinelloides 1006PhL]KAF1796042.1 hypothetical protein FB192DRAFT_1407169 [Mucor lusitanicus]KAG1089639.1 hypothetical protein G6F42_019924 [Rhizopus arrhizus]KAK4513341.1 hypothetical protein ATC70_005335 [Mucor velutinosus]OAC98304.1 hypothetical protein MUCCIDRAFT_115836 [Mucor lusitanicus CBS 277.49]
MSQPYYNQQPGGDPGQYYSAPPPGQQGYYQPAPPPQTIIVQQERPQENDHSCCWGCLVAMCICCALDEIC